MTLIVENGSVVTGAESYITIAQHKVYCDNRGISYSALTDTQLEQNARKAFDYLLQQYRGKWKGYRKDALQVGDWPRSFVYLEPFINGAVGAYPYLVADNIIPVEVMSAQHELMVRLPTVDSLMPDLGQKELSITIGPISVDYDPNSQQNTRYETVDRLLIPYLLVNSATNSVVRG